MQAYMLGGAYLGGSTVDLYQLKGNIDQVQHPSSYTINRTDLACETANAKEIADAKGHLALHSAAALWRDIQELPLVIACLTVTC